jgi:hypothetical protein
VRGEARARGRRVAASQRPYLELARTLEHTCEKGTPEAAPAPRRRDEKVEKGRRRAVHVERR